MKTKSATALALILCAVAAGFFLAGKHGFLGDRFFGHAPAAADASGHIGATGAAAGSGDPTDAVAGVAGSSTQTAFERNALATTRPAARAALLPWESRFLPNGQLSLAEVRKAIFDKRFDEAMRSFDAEMARDSEAQDVRDAYRSRFEGMLKGGGATELSGLTCGLSLCVGSIRAVGADGAAQYAAWNNGLYKPGGAPTYSFIDAEIPLGANVVEHRFFFSTDSAADAMNIPR